MRKFIVILMLLLLACSKPQAQPTIEAPPAPMICDPSKWMPELPPGAESDDFDWRPVAEEVCAQFKACGMGSPDCVENYLDYVEDAKKMLEEKGPDWRPEPPPDREPRVVIGEPVTFTCEDSLEAQKYPGICDMTPEDACKKYPEMCSE